jgi:hypothetical protein
MTADRRRSAAFTEQSPAPASADPVSEGVVRPVRGILLSTVLGGAVASAANAIVAFAGLAPGADPTLPGLTPPAFITLSILGVLVAAIGWTVVGRARSAKRILTVLVPTLLALSLLPDIALALTASSAAVVTAAVTLGIMHVVTVAVAVPVYRTFLPLPK